MTVTTIILLLLALAVGVLVGWLIMKPRNTALQRSVASLDKEVEMLDNQLGKQRADADALLLKQDSLNAEKAALMAEAEALKRELAILKERAEQDDNMRNKAFERQLQMAKEQMQNETRKVLEQRAEALGKTNNEQMAGVVGPLKEQLEAMRKQVNESLKTSTESRTSIEKAIEHLVRRTEEMSNDANNLARALKNESKTQGNWGEMILDTILENSGLEKGVHYETQVTLRDEMGRAISNDETGSRMIPDVVVHYPDEKDVIIDSKVSLTAYLDYCNAETDDERDAALKRHLDSVRQHVRELRQKNYAHYIRPPRQALQYMIMFVPNEMAMQLALQNDQSLWREAFDDGICITSEQNLIVILRMIQMAWTQVQQYQNQKEIMLQAKTLLDRVALFMERFNKIDTGIDDLKRRFMEANTSLCGQQGILVAAKKMEKLGVKTGGSRQLPDMPVLPMEEGDVEEEGNVEEESDTE